MTAAMELLARHWDGFCVAVELVIVFGFWPKTEKPDERTDRHT